MKSEKISWEGEVTAIQPRICLLRSFDQRHHNYRGYALRFKGLIGESEQTFLIGIGKAAQEKHQFRVGDVVKGESQPVLDHRMEVVEFYKTSKLGIVKRGDSSMINPPP